MGSAAGSCCVCPVSATIARSKHAAQRHRASLRPSGQRNEDPPARPTRSPSESSSGHPHREPRNFLVGELRTSGSPQWKKQPRETGSRTRGILSILSVPNALRGHHATRFALRSPKRPVSARAASRRGGQHPRNVCRRPTAAVYLAYQRPSTTSRTALNAGLTLSC
jgi:hypothetical protein